MFVALLAKEVKLSLHSFKYVGSFLIIAVAIVASVVSLGESYRHSLYQYQLDEHQRNEMLDTKAHGNRMEVLLRPSRPPATMSVLFWDQTGDAETPSLFKNPISLLYRKFDFADIIVFLVSIVAIIMSYDAVSGEREMGTLRLQSVFGVTRPMLLATKLVAGIIAISFPIVVGLSIALTYLAATGLLHWSISEWLSLAVILAAALLYFGCFFCAGLLSSALSPRSATSLVVVYLIWILLVILIPNTSPFVARQIYPVTGVAAVKSEMVSLEDEQRDVLGRQLAGEVSASFAARYGEEYEQLMAGTESQRESLLNNNTRLRTLYEEWRRAHDSAWSEANSRMQKQARRLKDDLDRRITRQAVLTRTCALASPGTNFISTVHDIAGVAASGQDYFQQAAGMYSHQFWSYLQEKIAECKQRNPQFTSEDYIDITDRPDFVYRERPLGQRLTSVWLYFVILGFFNLAFLIAASIAFHRYDIR